MTDKETIKKIFEILQREKEVENFLSPVEFQIFELVKENLKDKKTNKPTMPETKSWINWKHTK
jgi:hypothetical protein